MELPRLGLVSYIWGNVSGIDREKWLLVIKLSGVEYTMLKPEDLVDMDLLGNKVEGNMNLSPRPRPIWCFIISSQKLAELSISAVLMLPAGHRQARIFPVMAPPMQTISMVPFPAPGT